MSSLIDPFLKKDIQDSIQTDSDRFDDYPIYLKHTLFHNDDEDILKVREMDVEQRMFVFDKIKERGNKYFNKESDYESIKVYEKALSIMKWLEVVEEKGLYQHLEEKLKEVQNDSQKDQEQKKEEIENIEQDMEYSK